MTDMISSEENCLTDVPCSSLAAVHMMSLLKVQVNDVIHTTTKPPRDKDCYKKMNYDYKEKKQPVGNAEVHFIPRINKRI